RSDRRRSLALTGHARDGGAAPASRSAAVPRRSPQAARHQRSAAERLHVRRHAARTEARQSGKDDERIGEGARELSRPARRAAMGARPLGRRARRVGGRARERRSRESEYELVRLDVQAIDTVSFGLGLLARLHKGSQASFQRRKVNGEAWLPATASYTISARLGLVAVFRRAATFEYSNYKKFGVDSS